MQGFIKLGFIKNICYKINSYKVMCHLFLGQGRDGKVYHFLQEENFHGCGFGSDFLGPFRYFRNKNKKISTRFSGKILMTEI